MKRSAIITLAIMLGLLACKTAEVAVAPSLNADPMVVKGRNGWQIGQVIEYGEFKTDKVRRGWTKGYDLPFIVSFRGAAEKLSYTQYGTGGIQAEVACVSKFRSTELQFIKAYFQVPLSMKNYFAGTVSLDEGQIYWDFILFNPNGDFLKDKPTTGSIRSGRESITIQPIRGLDGQPQFMKKMYVYGHEFVLDNKVVAAVSTLNKGTVWIAESLSDEIKTVIAAVATGLLLRTDVEEAVES
jgi:hypothetical protein